jgi:Na+:H+ antiporter, NhaA family
MGMQSAEVGPSAWLRELMGQESAGGIALVAAAALAVLAVSSPFAGAYDALLDTPVALRVGALHLAKPLLLWINDGLMTVFFLLVGLEVKREILEGELSQPRQVLLPGIGALGGMLAPAAIYTALNWGDPQAMGGWAIPAATDIAFSLGVLSLLGERVPTSLRVFLLALAIFDDLGAILIIALFYTADLSELALELAAVAVVALWLLNLAGVTRIGPYLVVGLALWGAVLESGVHATLAGVMLGLAIPLRGRGPGHSPLRRLEHRLHPWVAFGIVPVFAFANAGVPIAGLTAEVLAQPVPLGIGAGLLFGKQLGVMLFCGALIRVGWAQLPSGASWSGLYGVAVLCGIGFTMSLFIASLAFEEGGGGPMGADRLGVLMGSSLAALAGYLVLRLGRPCAEDSPTEVPARSP